MTQAQAFNLLKLGHNVFLTGPAGSGKTYLLNQFIDYLRKNRVEVGITASTGIAATHLGGMTIHSWSGLGIKDALTEEDMVNLLVRGYMRTRLNRAQVLIIDEVSMLHAHQLDLVDKVLKAFRQNQQPFGGIQIVLCGDLFQLPPVTKDKTPAQFMTAARIWPEAEFHICYLEEQFRQTDSQLQNILNAIRYNDVDDTVFEALKERFGAPIDNLTTPTKLYSHNFDVDTVNGFELDKINNEIRVFDMRTLGTQSLVETMVKGCLAPTRLGLKIGAQVMFVKNNFEKGYVNGTIGTVADWDNDGFPVVSTLDGRYIETEVASWKVEEDGKTRAELIQIPLRLAWAITIHKSQGMSLDAAEVDLSKTFVAGMGYVALSRVRTLDGLTIKGMNNTALQINQNVLELDQLLKQQSEKSVEWLDSFKTDELQDHQIARLTSMSLAA